MKSYLGKHILILTTMSITLLHYQNCSFLGSANSHNLFSQNLDILIQDSRTFSIKIQTQIPKLTREKLLLKGTYSYPVRGQKELTIIPIENMHLFYSCSDTPKYCELTFKIPEESSEMDLSKLLSMNSILEFKIYNSSHKLQNDYKISMNSRMLRENYSEVHE
jgi:hypothetical protein